MAKNTYYESIMTGLQQAIDFEKGDTSKGRIRIVEMPEIEPLNEYPKEKIKELRQKVNLPQKYFAELLGVTIKSVEAWESGKRQPTGTAKRLFQLIEKDPNVVNIMMK
ncbi:MAG: helix-turn-helix domain-containing protein [Oscillospiraceae bacterium]|jgi:putative transcriptional regulator|nr:helix-turn-helix domain-containing protein [Oscillospiraceae bacterium]